MFRTFTKDYSEKLNSMVLLNRKMKNRTLNKQDRKRSSPSKIEYQVLTKINPSSIYTLPVIQ